MIAPVSQHATQDVGRSTDGGTVDAWSEGRRGRRQEKFVGPNQALGPGDVVPRQQVAAVRLASDQRKTDGAAVQVSPVDVSRP